MAPTAQSILEAIETAIAVFLAGVTGWTAVNGRDPGPRPAGPFVEFQLVREEGTDSPVAINEYTPAVGDAPDSYTQTIQDPTYITVQITANGAGAISALNKVRLKTRSASRQWDIFQLCGLGGCDEIQNTTTEFEGKQMVQAAVNLHLNAVLEETEATDYFSRATYHVAADDVTLSDIIIEAPA